MKSELVASSSQRSEFKSRDRHSSIGCGSGEHVVQISDLSAARHDPFREARLPVFEVDHLPRSIVEILPNREIDLAGIEV